MTIKVGDNLTNLTQQEIHEIPNGTVVDITSVHGTIRDGYLAFGCQSWLLGDLLRDGWTLTPTPGEMTAVVHGQGRIVVIDSVAGPVRRFRIAGRDLHRTDVLPYTERITVASLPVDPMVAAVAYVRATKPTATTLLGNAALRGIITAVREFDARQGR